MDPRDSSGSIQNRSPRLIVAGPAPDCAAVSLSIRGARRPRVDGRRESNASAADVPGSRGRCRELESAGVRPDVARVGPDQLADGALLDGVSAPAGGATDSERGAEGGAVEAHRVEEDGGVELDVGPERAVRVLGLQST